MKIEEVNGSLEKVWLQCVSRSIEEDIQLAKKKKTRINQEKRHGSF